MKTKGSIIIISLLLFVSLFSAGCIDTSEESIIPPPEQDLSGKWHTTYSYMLYGDGDIQSSNLIYNINIEQDGRVFYITGDFIDGTGVGVTINKEGNAFFSDISTDSYRGLITGESRGDELWISYTGIFTKNVMGYTKGDRFSEVYRFVRDGKDPVDTSSITPFKSSYPYSVGFIMSQEKTVDLSGDTLVIEKQQGGIISGTMNSFIGGEKTPADFTGGMMFTDVDGRGYNCEYYLVIDEVGRFLVITHYIQTDDICIMTSAHSVHNMFPEETVAVFMLYGEDTGYSNPAFGVTPPSMLGTWLGVEANKININRIKEEFYPGVGNFVKESDVMFTGSFVSKNVPTVEIVGAFLSPTSNELFIASPRAGDENSVFAVGGWVEGDTLYACGIYESFGVKTATIEVFDRIDE